MCVLCKLKELRKQFEEGKISKEAMEIELDKIDEKSITKHLEKKLNELMSNTTKFDEDEDEEGSFKHILETFSQHLKNIASSVEELPKFYIIGFKKGWLYFEGDVFGDPSSITFARYSPVAKGCTEIKFGVYHEFNEKFQQELEEHEILFESFDEIGELQYRIEAEIGDVIHDIQVKPKFA